MTAGVCPAVFLRQQGPLLRPRAQSPALSLPPFSSRAPPGFFGPHAGRAVFGIQKEPVHSTSNQPEESLPA